MQLAIRDMVADMQTVLPRIWIFTSRSSSEWCEKCQAFIGKTRQRHRAMGNVRVRGAVATRYWSGRPRADGPRGGTCGSTRTASISLGAHSSRWLPTRSTCQLRQSRLSLPASVASPSPLHFHAAGVVAHVDLSFAPCDGPRRFPWSTMSGPAHGLGVLGPGQLGEGHGPVLLGAGKQNRIHGETDCVHTRSADPRE